MQKLLAFSTVFLVFFTASAHANLPGPQTKTGIGLMAQTFGTDDYRLGDEWGKRQVRPEDLAQASPAFQRAAQATAKVGGATGFYLGKFNGQHVMATNHHVYESARSCGTVRFPLLNVTANCDQFIGSFPEIDLALFTVRVSATDEAKLLGVAGNFRFHEDIKMGEKVLTVGFGVAGNPGGALMANQDSDCIVFSKDAEYRLMADPDQWNPGSYRAWSFALGCDVSHGDSGSAIVDRDSGNVIGIIWTGRIPKSDNARKSSFLKSIYQSRDNAIWDELSYAVPAKKMGEFLGRLVESGIPENHKQILRAMLQ